MGKEKEKVEFNPADYGYLNNNLPLEGWIWEFIRRNPEYRRLYSEIKKDPNGCKHPDILLREYGMEANRDLYIPLPKEKFLTIKEDSPVKIKTKHSRSRDITLGVPNPDITYEDFKRYYLEKRKEHLEMHKEHFGNLKDYLEKYSIFSSNMKPKEYFEEFEKNFKTNCIPIILKSKIVTTHMFHNYWVDRYKELSLKNAQFSNEDFRKYCVYHLLNTLTIREVENTIYLGIAIYAKYEDIKQELKKIYKKYIKPIAKKRIREKEWFDYLIAYDLKKEGYKLKDIASLLYPNEPNEYSAGYPVSEKIGEHIKGAKKLIEEKTYLDFLFPVISKKPAK